VTSKAPNADLCDSSNKTSKVNQNQERVKHFLSGAMCPSKNLLIDITLKPL
jgi:hypothetical protein